MGRPGACFGFGQPKLDAVVHIPIATMFESVAPGAPHQIHFQRDGITVNGDWLTSFQTGPDAAAGAHIENMFRDIGLQKPWFYTVDTVSSALSEMIQSSMKNSEIPQWI